MEIPRIVVRLARPQSTAGIAPSRVLDLDHLGAEPGKRFGAGRPCLELREIDDPHAFETIQFHAHSIHRWFLPFVGWVERSEAHRLRPKMMGFAPLNPSYVIDVNRRRPRASPPPRCVSG